MSTADLPQPVEETGPGLLGDGAARPGRYNLALLRRAINQGWDIPEEARKLLVKQMGKTLKDGTERGQIGAAKVLLTADGANLKRAELELKAEELENPQTEQHEHEHKHSHVVVIVEDEGWYGNDAHAKAAQSAATPIAGPDQPSEVQGGGLRPEVGQNGHGSTNGSAGPRPH